MATPGQNESDRINPVTHTYMYLDNVLNGLIDEWWWSYGAEYSSSEFVYIQQTSIVYNLLLHMLH